MLILKPESTCKWHCNMKSNSHSGCKNEQQVDFEVQLENRMTITRHCRNLCSKLQPNAENFHDFMLILDPESTCKWHCDKKSNSHLECKNEQQADFEVQLENKISIAGH